MQNTVMPTHRAARIGLWLLPAYGILLGLGTLTHQPPVEDFDAYARYITTDVFLVSHLGASIFGAALAVLGVVAVTAYLVPGRAARLAVVGLVLTTIANIYLSAAFGSAAFVQPGIGRAHLAGVPGMPALNADTAYGPALGATALRCDPAVRRLGNRARYSDRTHPSPSARRRSGVRGASPALRNFWLLVPGCAVGGRIRCRDRNRSPGRTTSSDR